MTLDLAVTQDNITSVEMFGFEGRSINSTFITQIERFGFVDLESVGSVIPLRPTPTPPVVTFDLVAAVALTARTIEVTFDAPLATAAFSIPDVTILTVTLDGVTARLFTRERLLTGVSYTLTATAQGTSAEVLDNDTAIFEGIAGALNVRTSEALAGGIFDARKVALTGTFDIWSTELDQSLKTNPGWTASNVTYNANGAYLSNGTLTTPSDYGDSGEFRFDYRAIKALRITANNWTLATPPGSGTLRLIRYDAYLRVFLNDELLHTTDDFGYGGLTLSWSADRAFVKNLRVLPALWIGPHLATQQIRYGRAIEVTTPIVTSQDIGDYPCVLTTAAGNVDVGTWTYFGRPSKPLGYGHLEAQATTIQFKHIVSE